MRNTHMKILNFGSLNLDYIYDVDHFVRAKETLSSLKMEVTCGGKGLNQSLALCRSGMPVWHAGAVGAEDSQMLLAMLNQAGVNTQFIRKKSGASGHAIIQKEKDGQNCILLYGGANQEIQKEEIDETLLHFEQGDFLILQNEINQIGYLMQKAHEKGMKIVFNPSPLNEKISAYPLHLADYLILNEIEGMGLCNQNEMKDAGAALAEELGKRFPNAKIVLTLGEGGSIYRDSERTIQQPIYQVKPVDTTAAGDTFTGFFLGSLLLEGNVEEALDIAAKASAIAVTRLGAGQSIPAMEEVLNFEPLHK